MSSELLFGFETEWLNYAEGVKVDAVAQAALRALARQVPHLPCCEHKGGIFLENSARCYVDCGTHLETCTPEVSDPRDLVAAVKAMERILLDTVEPASRELGAGARIRFGRANVDPSTRVTYGQHENFLCAHAPGFYSKFILPFLVTRTIWSGAGGLAPGASGAVFAVSPRLLLFDSVSGDRAVAPSILSPREEPLAGAGNYRLHIVAGETLSSELGLYLKAGVSALVVRAADLGEQIGLEILDPVKSLHAVALDATCQEGIPLSDGRRLTAVQVQRAYLALVEKHLPELPDWASETCLRWRDVLDALSKDPMLLSQSLDWPIKYNIWRAQMGAMDRHAEGRDLLRELLEQAAHTAYRHGSPPLGLLLGPSSPILHKVAELNADLRRRGLQWTDLAHLPDDRARLAEILDIRYGILGEGIFDAIADSLAHRMVSDQAIERATKEAPRGGRANLRSRAIKELAGRTYAYCWWDYVADGEWGRLDLSDPRCQSARWPRRFSPAPSDSPETGAEVEASLW